MLQSKRWEYNLNYFFWGDAAISVFNNGQEWSIYKKATSVDEYYETMRDAVYCYCAGGEL